MKIQLIAAAALLLAACSTTEYVFTPPETAEGKACVERCQATQSSCRREQDVRADHAKAQCEADSARREKQCAIQAPIEYAACLRFARNDEERAACALEDCTQPACYASPQYGLCDGDFRFCYQNCGGKIDLIER
ncbi:MAG: hypothetical protein ACREE7_07025 [Dongiaceae bacterium]